MTQRRAHILVIEDAEEVREIIVLLLEGDGFSVDACAETDRALALIRRHRPDLILTDLMLGPSASGLDLITRVRSDLAPPIPPIVVCSGFNGFEEEAMSRGAVAFIPKPFEPSTILKTVTAILERGWLAERARDEALERSRSLRAKAVEAAEVAMQRLEPRRPDMDRRAQWTTDFLPRYFGFGEAFVTVLGGGDLQVWTSSNERVWKRGQALDLAICRDILETSSALVVPDLLTLGALVRGPNGAPLRFFTGVPLTNGPTTVGALCFVDTAPRRIGSDGYSLLEALGHRGSALLSARESEVAPVWAPSGLMTREGLCVVLTAELSRMVEETPSLGLLVFSGEAPTVELSARTVVASLDAQRFAVLLARDSDTAARQAMLDLVSAIARPEGFAAGGLLTVENGAAGSFEARNLLHAAEGLLEAARRAAPGTIERIAIRREQRIAAPLHV
jgi:CheY-like chemotaxis protein